MLRGTGRRRETQPNRTQLKQAEKMFRRRQRWKTQVRHEKERLQALLEMVRRRKDSERSEVAKTREQKDKEQLQKET